jgi:hypothetical protein
VAWYLRIDGESWRLPPDADVEGVDRTVYGAMVDGNVVAIDVQLSDEPRSTKPLYVNGATIRMATVAEVEEKSHEIASFP